jgi:hypothetical protein
MTVTSRDIIRWQSRIFFPGIFDSPKVPMLKSAELLRFSSLHINFI